jgi:disulfide bond formation protein DsbB
MLKLLKKYAPSFRLTHFIAFLICVGLIGFALYLQTTLNLAPCPLCVIQRVVICVLALLFLFGALNPASQDWRVWHNGLIVIVALFGAVVAGRQVWLQQHPEQATTCGPGLNYMLHNLPFQDVVRFLMSGTADCARKDWFFWGWTMPQWTLVFFCFFAVLGFIQACRRRRRKHS